MKLSKKLLASMAAIAIIGFSGYAFAQGPGGWQQGCSGPGGRGYGMIDDYGYGMMGGNGAMGGYGMRGGRGMMGGRGMNYGYGNRPDTFNRNGNESVPYGPQRRGFWRDWGNPWRNFDEEDGD